MTEAASGKPGQIALNRRNGQAVVLGRRKEDDSGWWLAGQHEGGLSDHALAGPDWVLLTEADLRPIAQQTVTTVHLNVDLLTVAQDVQHRVADFADEMRALGIHVGVNGRCPTCGADWPCPRARAAGGA